MAVRIALLGYGLAGRVFHAPLIAAEPRTVVSHVVTRDPQRRAQVEHDLPEARLVDDPAALWERADEFDAVVIATPNASHLPLAVAALDLGKPTVVDKPLALTAAEAHQLVTHRPGVPRAVFANRRWDSDTIAAQHLLRQEALGDVVRLESRFTRFRPDVADRWREEPTQGGGILLDLGPHVVDQALHLLGPVTTVYAEVDSRRPGAHVDDDCFLALTHVSGARSHLWCSLAAPVPGPRLLLQGTRAGWCKEQLDGQEAALRAGWTPTDGPLPEPPGRLFDSLGEHAVASPPGDWAAFYRGFAAAVLDGAPVPVPAADGLTVVRVLEAARRSAADGATVAL